MSEKKSSNIRVISMSLATVIGAIILIFFPNLISGVWKVLAWAATAATATTAGVFHHIEKKKEALIEERKLAQIRRKRMAQMKKDREALAERVQKAQERAEVKEEKRTEKQLEIKAEMVQQAETVWADKEKYAADQENIARDIIKRTNDMEICTVAGSVAIEWHEAGALAQWTAQQLIMFSRRPDVTTQARDEAQEAIIEAANIKASGNVLTDKQAIELKKQKEKARAEAQIEEDRLDDIRDAVEKAEMKWRVAESRAKRGQEELSVLMKKSIYKY